MQHKKDGVGGSRPQLGYWNMRCIGEPIRLLLNYAGVDFEDVRFEVGPPPLYDKSAWQRVKNDLDLVFPNLPFWIDPTTNTRLTQTHAILRHLGERHGLAGETEQQRALAQMVQEHMRDWMHEFFEVTYCSMGDVGAAENVHRLGATQAAKTCAKFEQLKQEYLTAKLPLHLMCFVRMLRSAEGSMWIAGTAAPTYADFQLAEYLDQHLVFEPRCLDGPHFEVLRTYLHRFEQLPQVSSYRRSGHFQVEPLHNRYSHFHCGWTGAALGSSDDVDGKGTLVGQSAMRRDLLAMFCLLCCLAGLVLLGRAVIGFDEVEAAIEEDMAALGSSFNVPIDCSGCCNMTLR